MSEVLVDILTSVVCLVVGFGLGQIVAWRTAKIAGRPFLVPTAHPGPKTQKIAAAVVIIVAIVSVISGMVTQARVEECNAAFRETIKARSAGTTEQFDAITTLQERLATADPGAPGDHDRYTARKDYVQRVAEIDAYRAAHPYPDTEC